MYISLYIYMYMLTQRGRSPESQKGEVREGTAATHNTGGQRCETAATEGVGFHAVPFHGAQTEVSSFAPRKWTQIGHDKTSPAHSQTGFLGKFKGVPI